MNEDWARRDNRILRAVNEGDAPDTIYPPLNDEEIAFYNRLIKTAEQEQARINQECAKKGLIPWRFEFELMEVD